MEAVAAGDVYRGRHQDEAAIDLSHIDVADSFHSGSQAAALAM